jgi:hypothetical protein
MGVGVVLVAANIGMHPKMSGAKSINDTRKASSIKSRLVIFFFVASRSPLRSARLTIPRHAIKKYV